MFRLIRTLTVLLALMGIFQGAAVAQNRHTGTNASQAVLTIQVKVVPTAMLPAPAASQSNQIISYSIPVAPARMSVTEQKQLFNLPDPAGQVGPHLVTVISVVPE